MLTHIGTSHIQTARLTLRPFLSDDAEPMFKNWASDDEVTRFLKWDSHRTVADTENIVNLWFSHYNQTDTYNWAIVLKDTGDVIGNISVVDYNESAEYAVIGYCIGRKWWNKDITSEAFSAVIEYLFEKVGFNSIRASHATKNPASGKVMEKCGLKYEGTLRQYQKSKRDGLLDLNYYSILKSEYLALENKK